MGLVGAQEREVQFGVAEVLGDPFFVGQGAEEGVGDLRGFGFQASQIFLEFGEGFVEGDNIDAGSAAGEFGDSGAGLHGFVEESFFHGAQDDAGDERDFEGDAVVAVVDPGGEVAEVLAGGPVAEVAEGAALPGGGD
jgi:hypothetical protein